MEIAESVDQTQWWFIISCSDWLASRSYRGVFPDFNETEAFVRICAAPEIAANSMRSEILLNAFASSVWTITPSCFKQIKGDAAELPMIKHFMDQLDLGSKWQRIIAFTAEV